MKQLLQHKRKDGHTDTLYQCPHNARKKFIIRRTKCRHYRAFEIVAGRVVASTGRISKHYINSIVGG